MISIRVQLRDFIIATTTKAASAPLEIGVDFTKDIWKDQATAASWSKILSFLAKAGMSDTTHLCSHFVAYQKKPICFMTKQLMAS